MKDPTSAPASVYVISWVPVSTYRSLDVAVKFATPPDGVTSVETGVDGSDAVAGPSTVAGVVVVQTGLISDAVGAATLPAICGGPAVASAVPSTVAPPPRRRGARSEPMAPARPRLPLSDAVPARSIRCRSAERSVT